jgi:hypothetical protein
MPKDSSCGRLSAACLTTLSLRNWNCVEGDWSDRPQQTYSFERGWSVCLTRFEAQASKLKPGVPPISPSSFFIGYLKAGREFENVLMTVIILESGFASIEALFLMRAVWTSTQNNLFHCHKNLIRQSVSKEAF